MATSNHNLEIFACLWLDQDVNRTEDNLGTQKELRQIINHLQTFDSSDRCEQYIQKNHKEKVVLIVSGSLGREVVPRMHTLPQLSACYVFCQNKSANEQWAKKYHKVKGVFIQRSELVSAIARDQNARGKIQEGASISVISHSAKSLQAHNAIFMWFQLFIEVLLRMHHKSTDRKELIDICKKNYKGNKQEMEIIIEFEKSYKADNAIWWYTREACFYRMMNKALRVQDYDMLFALRFFITDVAKQLKNEHENFIRTSDTRGAIKVYRGQGIGKDELDLMKSNIGEFLSMNSFLSTSRKKSTAIDFARFVSTEDGNQPILFEIEINPRLKTKAFADVSKISYYEKEDEILIMLGALFRIDKVMEDKKNGIWIAHISLASEDDYHLKETFAFMKEKIGDDTDLDSLGKILNEMGEYHQAKKCYKRMLEEHQLGVGDAYSGLGVAYKGSEDYEQSLQHYTHSLQIRTQILGEKHEKVGESFYRIAGVNLLQGDYEQALPTLMKATKILEDTDIVDQSILFRTYDNLAITYHKLEEFDLALENYNKALEMQYMNLPADHPDTAITLNNLGCLYDDNGQFLIALEYYEKSLEISRKILPPTHERITQTEKNIKRLKEKLSG